MAKQRNIPTVQTSCACRQDKELTVEQACCIANSIGLIDGTKEWRVDEELSTRVRAHVGPTGGGAKRNGTS